MAKNPEVEAALKGLIQDGEPEEKESIENKEVTDKDVKIKRAILTKVISTRYKNAGGNPAKVKILTTVTTTDTFPDGSTRSTVEGNIVLKDAEPQGTKELQKNLEGFSPTGKPKEKKDVKNEKVTENGVEIERKTTITTTVQEYKNDKNQKRTKTTVLTEVEDKRPDGTVSVSKREEVSLAEDNSSQKPTQAEMAAKREIDNALKDLKQVGQPEVTENKEVQDVEENGAKIKRTVTTKVTKTKYGDNKGNPKKLKTEITTITNDVFPDGTDKSYGVTQLGISEL